MQTSRGKFVLRIGINIVSGFFVNLCKIKIAILFIGMLKMIIARLWRRPLITRHDVRIDDQSTSQPDDNIKETQDDENENKDEEALLHLNRELSF